MTLSFGPMAYVAEGLGIKPKLLYKWLIVLSRLCAGYAL